MVLSDGGTVPYDSTGSNPKGGTVSFVNGQLSLLQALAQVGFGTTEHVQGKLSETVVMDNLIGGENRGWYVNAATMDFERSGISRFAFLRRTLDRRRPRAGCAA